MIIIILLVGLVLRVISLGQSLWLDEAINVLAFQDNSLWQLITQYSKVDFHPPGYFILMWFWVHIFNNYSEEFVRIPSVVFGVATIYMVYILGKELHSKKLGLITALLVAVNPLLIYYSQEARMYSAASFGVIVNFLFLVKFVKNKKDSGASYLMTLPLVFLFDYLTYFVIFDHFFLLLFFSKDRLKKWIMLTFPTLILLLIWGFVFYGQFLTGLTTAGNVKGWAEVVGGADLKNLALLPVKFTIGRISLSDKFFYALTVSPILIYCGYLIISGLLNLKNRLRMQLIFLVFLLIIIPFLVSIFVPVFSYFRFLYVVPFYCLALAFGLINLKKWPLFFTLLVLIFSISSLFYLFDSKYQREDWKGVLRYNRITTVIDSNGYFAPLEYYNRFPELVFGSSQSYSPQFLIVPALKNFPAERESDLSTDLDSKLTTLNRIDYLEYLSDISDPHRLAQKRIETLGFKLIGKKDFNGVGFLYEYEK